MPKKPKAIVTHLTKIPEGTSMVASVRIARYLSNQLSIPLMHLPDEKVADQDWDVVFLVNSPTGFAPAEMRWQVARMANRAKHFIFVQNDYKMNPQSQIRRVAESMGKEDPTTIRWTTVPHLMRGHRLDSYINWNQLTYAPLTAPHPRPVHGGVLYWGALRKGRESAFERLLSGRHYPVTISTSPQSVKKFQEYCPKAQYTYQLKGNLIRNIARYKFTLYIEDEYSHRHYCSPANRFYEAISANETVLLVDEQAADTITQSGLEVPECLVVNTHRDVRSAMRHYPTLIEAQRRAWQGYDFRSILDKELQQAWNRLKANF